METGQSVYRPSHALPSKVKLGLWSGRGAKQDCAGWALPSSQHPSTLSTTIKSQLTLASRLTWKLTPRAPQGTQWCPEGSWRSSWSNSSIWMGCSRHSPTADAIASGCASDLAPSSPCRRLLLTSPVAWHRHMLANSWRTAWLWATERETRQQSETKPKHFIPRFLSWNLNSSRLGAGSSMLLSVAAGFLNRQLQRFQILPQCIPNTRVSASQATALPTHPGQDHCGAIQSSDFFSFK